MNNKSEGRVRTEKKIAAVVFVICIALLTGLFQWLFLLMANGQ